MWSIARIMGRGGGEETGHAGFLVYYSVVSFTITVKLFNSDCILFGCDTFKTTFILKIRQQVPPERLVPIFQTTWCRIPGDFNLNIYCHKNFKTPELFAVKLKFRMNSCMVIISDFLNEIYRCIYSNFLLKELFGKISVSKRNLR
jgi:hypothetical protein